MRNHKSLPHKQCVKDLLWLKLVCPASQTEICKFEFEMPSIALGALVFLVYHLSLHLRSSSAEPLAGLRPQRPLLGHSKGNMDSPGSLAPS